MTGALRLTGATLGVGLLLLLPVTSVVPGAPWVWVLCGVLGMLVGVTVSAGRCAPPSESPVVRAWYVAGTSVGQGFICWTAAAYLGGALGLGRSAIAAVAVGVLLSCAVIAVRWQRMGAVFRRARHGATIVLVVVWACYPGALVAAGDALGPVPGGVAAAVFLVLISAVGWESTRTLVGERTIGAVLFAGAVVIALTAGLTVLHRAIDETGVAAPSALRTVLSATLLVLAASYCVTNLQFAGRILGGLLGERKSRYTTVGWVTVGAAVAMILAWSTGNGTWQLLAGPGSATWAIFAGYAARVLFDRESLVPARITAASALVPLGWTAVAQWQALLFPLLVGSVVVGAGRLRGRSFLADR